jgi:predicted phage terminase large subunit-like protein
MKAFAELIKFHGGWGSFGECHSELVDFVTTPQVNEAAQQKLAYQGDEAEAHLRRLILMPRGHLKSTIGTILYTLWRIYRNPNIRILVACHKQELSYAFIRALRSQFENPELESVWNKRPHITGALLPKLQAKTRDRNFNIETDAEDRKVIWNNVALQVIRDIKAPEPTVLAASVGASVTGQHYDLVIFDDLINFDNVESESKKHRVEEWIQDIESVLNPPQVTVVKGKDGFSIPEILGGELIVTGTRYAVDDYYGQIIERQEEIGFKVHSRNIYKNGKDNTDGYLWHEKYNERLISSLQARLSPRRFASQYLNTVYEKDHALLNPNAIQVIADDDVFTNQGRLCVRLASGRIEILNQIIAVDPAFSTSKTSDDCAILVGGKLSDGRLVLADASCDRMIAAEVVAKVIEFATKYNAFRLYYEENGVGKLVPELFKGDSATVDGRRIICNGHYEQRNKESKIQGVLELPINSGKLLITQRVRNNEYIWKQLVNYPAVRHDDFLDGLVTLYEYSVPSREQYNHSLQVNLDPYRLNLERLLDKTTTQESYLGQYNRHYA